MTLATFLQTTDLSQATADLTARHLQVALSCMTKTEMPTSVVQVVEALQIAGYPATEAETAEMLRTVAARMVPLAANRQRAALYRGLVALAS
jgi:hypothetical protein